MKQLSSRLHDLSGVHDDICLSMAIPTHRTFPENKQDIIVLKNAVSRAENKLIEQFGKRGSAEVITRLNDLISDIDTNHSLDSLHIFVSNEKAELFNMPIQIESSSIEIGNNFNLSLLNGAVKNNKEYLILVLSQGGTILYSAFNDHIILEVRNEDFPFRKNNHYITHSDKASDPNQVDNMVREYFNKVDKAVVRAATSSSMKCVVVSTPRNYQHLLSVADSPALYLGNSKINYNDVRRVTIGAQAWAVVMKGQ